MAKHKTKQSAPDSDLTARLLKLYSGIIHDVMRGMGLKDFTLPSTIRAFTGDKKIAGPAFTVRGQWTPAPIRMRRCWLGPASCPKRSPAISSSFSQTTIRSRIWANCQARR